MMSIVRSSLSDGTWVARIECLKVREFEKAFDFYSLDFFLFWVRQGSVAFRMASIMHIGWCRGQAAS